MKKSVSLIRRGVMYLSADRRRSSTGNPKGLKLPHPFSTLRPFTFEPMNSTIQPKNPLHGVTLEQMLVALVDSLGWERMGSLIAIRCFTHDPSIASSLKFLRRTPWARSKVEDLYLQGMSG